MNFKISENDIRKIVRSEIRLRDEGSKHQHVILEGPNEADKAMMGQQQVGSVMRAEDGTWGAKNRAGRVMWFIYEEQAKDYARTTHAPEFAKAAPVPEKQPDASPKVDIDTADDLDKLQPVTNLPPTDDSPGASPTLPAGPPAPVPPASLPPTGDTGGVEGDTDGDGKLDWAEEQALKIKKKRDAESRLPPTGLPPTGDTPSDVDTDDKKSSTKSKGYQTTSRYTRYDSVKSMQRIFMKTSANQGGTPDLRHGADGKWGPYTQKAWLRFLENRLTPSQFGKVGRSGGTDIMWKGSGHTAAGGIHSVSYSPGPSGALEFIERLAGQKSLGKTKGGGGPPPPTGVQGSGGPKRPEMIRIPIYNDANEEVMYIMMYAANIPEADFKAAKKKSFKLGNNKSVFRRDFALNIAGLGGHDEDFMVSPSGMKIPLRDIEKITYNQRAKAGKGKGKEVVIIHKSKSNDRRDEFHRSPGDRDWITKK